MPIMAKKKALYADIPEDLKARLDRLAEHRARKLAAEVTLAIRHWVEQEEKKEGLFGVPIEGAEPEEDD